MIGQPLVGTPLQLQAVQSCTKCLAKKFVYESRNFCCGDGAIILPSSTHPPQLIRLFTSSDLLFVHFRQFARIYVFKLRGQIYHNVPDLVPQDNNPKYLQLYFYDGQHEAANRTACFKELNRAVIDILMTVTRTNPYARFFRSLQEINITHDTKIQLTQNPAHDQRVSNAPTSDEVAAIWSEDSTSGETNGPHILVFSHSQTSHKIMHFYGCYDPLQYPLLFPKGECGWHQGLKKNVATSQVRTNAESETAPPESFSTTEALLEAEAHQSSHQVHSKERNNRLGNMILRAGRCLQQYVVDMHNQDTIRAELYQGLLDTIDTGEQCAANVGRRVILPATYIGGPRDMKMRYLNAMALVQRYEEAQNRPDLVARIVEQKIFGEVAAFVYVMNCPDDFDKFVAVLRHMMHGPCGHLGRCKRRQTGHDRISFNVAPEADSGRWVSPVEAIWRIYGFDLFEIHPPVMALPIHLPGMQTIQMRPHEKTPLTEFFRINSENADKPERKYLYGNFTEHYRWDTIEQTWLVFVTPSEGERLFIISTNLATCLFATILIFCQPKDPTTVWDKYYTSLSEDYSREHLNDAYTTKELTVRQLERHLEAMGKSLKTFGLAHLNEHQDALLYQSQDILDALNARIPEQCMISRNSLNSEQQEAFNIIIKHVRESKPGAFFVDGPGGTGKTYLYNALYAELQLMGKIVLPTATSRIAAANIPSGRTTHSRFKLPIDLEISLSCVVPKQSSLAALIRATSLIIWDEASMARRESVEALDQLLRDLCNPDLIFGGKLIVFGGDFRQVLPVVQHKSIREVVKSSMVASVIWPQLTKFRMTINMRASYFQLPEGIVQDTCEIGTDLIAAVADTAYPESDIRNIGTSIFNNRSILTPTNEDVDDINTFMINKFPGTPVMYRGFDSMLTENCNIYPSEFINKLCPGGMSPYELILKKNCPVILLRNLFPSAGLCNGTRLICVQFTPNVIECIITNGHHSGEHVFIPRIKLRPSSSSNYPFQFQRNQFLLKLSFAMTINKSQGQTLDQVAVYLPRPCFSPASRVTVVAASTEHSSSQHSVKNIVSFEVLRLAGII
ncbi:hypothetical protein RND81_14G180300 [Saponaria officinalis]|uniref:ATP-dependent DNA helicase n=1 Tax=Saponaria officinalis TaxID=3572 RepID=A0AAW1GRK0_SAPOF